MERRNYNRNNRYNHYRKSDNYENGSAVRETSYDYNYSEEEYQRYARRKNKLDNLHDRRVREQAREERAAASRLRQLEKSRGINLISCIVFCLCAFAVYKLAAGYLDVNSNITATQKQIAEVESDYDTLKAKNDSALAEVNTSVDLKKIYEIATKELGMVFATDNQIIEYQNNEAAYVRNYEDIPDEPENNVFDDVLESLD